MKVETPPTEKAEPMSVEELESLDRINSITGEMMRRVLACDEKPDGDDRCACSRWMRDVITRLVTTRDVAVEQLSRQRDRAEKAESELEAARKQIADAREERDHFEALCRAVAECEPEPRNEEDSRALTSAVRMLKRAGWPSDAEQCRAPQILTPEEIEKRVQDKKEEV